MLKTLLEKRAAALARCEDLQALAETRELTDVERTEFRSKLDEAKNLLGEIRAAEELIAARTEQEAAETRAAASTETRADQLVRRPGAAATTHDNTEDKPWESAGHFFQAVRRTAENRGDVTDPRLRKHDVRIQEIRAAAGLNETVGAEGGFLVGQDVYTDLMKAAFDSGQVASRTRKIPLSNSANSIRINGIDETSRANGSRWGGVQAYWADEADTLTGSKPKFNKIELNLKKLIGLCYSTDELDADASALGSILSQAFADEFSFKLDDAVIRGTGTGTPLGILPAACTVSVAKETSQAAATILYANVSKMKQRMLPRSFNNAVWFVNVDCGSALEQMFIPATNKANTENVGGFPAYLPPGGASGNPYGMLFGRPVIPIEQCETLGTVGDIILADLGLYLMATKGGIQSASSIHVKFLTDELAYRFVLRTDGQPALKSAVTPYKGSGTLSAFVTLATRS